MSRIFAWLAGGATALGLVIAIALPSGASPTLADEPPVPLPPTEGPAVYAETCAKCHGADGKGDTGMGRKAREAGKKWPDLTTTTVDAAKAKEIIENGVAGTPMKAFKDRLTPEALTNVRDYVLKFRSP